MNLFKKVDYPRNNENFMNAYIFFFVLRLQLNGYVFILTSRSIRKNQLFNITNLPLHPFAKLQRSSLQLHAN